MNKIFLIICLLLGCLNINAQSEKAMIKKYIQMLKDSTGEKEKLEDQLKNLKEEFEQIKDRKFVQINNSVRFEEHVRSYSTIEKMYSDKTFRNNLLSGKWDNYQLAHNYKQLMQMYGSLCVIYKRETNDKYLALIESSSLALANGHKQDFLDSYNKLQEGIKDYAFILSELVGLFDSIDSSEFDVNASNNVDKIPFAKKQLNLYQKSSESARKNIRTEVEKALEEALAD